MIVKSYFFQSIPGAVIFGSLIVAFSILVSGNIIRIRGINDRSTSATTTTQGATGGSNKEKLIALAKDLKLDEKKFASCLDSEQVKKEIDKDISDAQGAGIQGTPGFIIGRSSNDGKITGVKVGGAFPLNVFNEIFEEFLKNTAAEQIPQNVISKAYPNASADDLSGVKSALTAGSIANVDDDPVLGDKEAPVTMVEFSDYECPFCKRHFSETLSGLRQNYIDTGKVKLVYRDFIAVPSHNPAATEEAIAANCAREQGGDTAYFKFHDEVFTKTKANGQGI